MLWKPSATVADFKEICSFEFRMCFDEYEDFAGDQPPPVFVFDLCLDEEELNLYSFFYWFEGVEAKKLGLSLD